MYVVIESMMYEIATSDWCLWQCCLNAWAHWVVSHDLHKFPMIIYVCCVGMFFLMLKHRFCWKSQYNKLSNMFKILLLVFTYMYNVFIPASGCVDRGPSTLLCPVAYDAVKTTLVLWDHFLLYTTLFDNGCQWLAAGVWFSQGTLVSSTNKTDRHDVTEILLKVAFKTVTSDPSIIQ